MAFFPRRVKVQEGLLDTMSLLTIVAHSTSQDLVPTLLPIYRLFSEGQLQRESQDRIIWSQTTHITDALRTTSYFGASLRKVAKDSPQSTRAFWWLRS